MACTSPDVFKCRLPDGRIMLVKKRKEPISQPSSATKPAVGQNIGAKVQPTRIPAPAYGNTVLLVAIIIFSVILSVGSL